MQQGGHVQLGRHQGAFDHGDEQRLFAGEVGIEPAFGQPGAGGDVVNARAAR